MRILRSIFKRKLTTFFFVVSYSIVILSFSIGNSVVEHQKLKVKYTNPENNKVLSITCNGNFKLTDLSKLLEGDRITLEVNKSISLNSSETFILSTNLINGGLTPFMNMKSGSYFTNEDFESDNNKAVFSSTIDISNGNYKFKLIQDDGTVRYIEVKGKGITTERVAKIIVPKKLFMENIGDVNLNQGDIQIKINGEIYDINNSISKVQSKVKEIDKEGKVLVSPYIIEDTSAEARELFKISFIIIIVIIINSVNISALWIEKRKKEIVLRKILGATNKDIFKLFFGELTIIAVISMILALLVQAVLSKLNNSTFMDINITLYKSNFYYALLIALATAYISAMPIYIYLLKIQPAQVLLEE